MKRFFLLCLVAMVTTWAYAQDIIVMNNGTRIESKVLSISETNIDYRLADYPGGPVFSVSVSKVNHIIFPNGTKQVFNAAVSTAQSEPTTYLNLERLKDRERHLRGWRNFCFIYGGIGLVVGTVCIIEGKNDYDEFLDEYDYEMVGLGIAACAEGAVSLIIGGVLAGKHKEAQAELDRIQSVPVASYDIPLGNCILAPSVNMLSEHQSRQRTLGVGLSLKF